MLRIGLIGCGDYCSRAHAKCLSEMPEAHIVAISECVYAGELEQRQRQFRIPYAFQRYEEMLRRVDLDGVVITTPHAFHFAQVRSCLERGLHVLLDKPPACHVGEIQSLVNLAHSAGRHLVVASQRRYNPVFRRWRDQVQAGELGELRFVRIHYGRDRYQNFAASWRNNLVLSGGGVLFDAGYHFLDSLLWVTGCRPLCAHGSLGRHGTEVETCVSLALELEGNVQVNISLHLEMAQHVVQEEIDLLGTRGALIYQYVSCHDTAPSAQLVTVQAGYQKREEVPRNASIDQAPAKNFISAILGQEAVVSSGRDSIETVRTIEWIYRELQARDRVR